MVETTRSGAGIAYRRYGPASGTSIVLLHGIPGSAAAWSAVADELSTDFDVIVPDLLGFGGSERPTSLADLHAAAQARALSRTLDELGVARAVVVGHDFGGPVALALHALRSDVAAGVALFATNAFTDTPIPFPLSVVTWPVVGAPFAKVMFSGPSLAMMLRSGVGRPRPKVDRAGHLGDHAQRRAIATIFRGSLTDLETLYRPIEDELRRLGAMGVPTFVGWGDRDPFFGVDRGELTASAAGCRLRVYEKAGHFLPEERSAEVAADLRRFAATRG